MTDKTEIENPSAFPMAVPQDWSEVQDGMELRDWFAGKALGGLMSHPALVPLYEEHYPLIVDRAYLLADLMLKKRGKG